LYACEPQYDLPVAVTSLRIGLIVSHSHILEVGEMGVVHQARTTTQKPSGPEISAIL